MRNRIALLVGTLALLFVIAIIVLAYSMLRHPHSVAAPIQQFLAHTPAQNKVVVLDFDDNGLLDEAELMQGRDAVITVHNPAATDTNADSLFNSASALQRLDLNKDGEINEKDVIFPYLRLMYFTDGGKGRRYVTFAEAGIKSLVIDQKRLHAITKSLDPQHNLIGEAEFTNGQHHGIRLILVNAQH